MPLVHDPIDAGARNAYAKCHHTYGPKTLMEYASPDIMRKQYEMAYYVIEGYLESLLAQARESKYA